MSQLTMNGMLQSPRGVGTTLAGVGRILGGSQILRGIDLQVAAWGRLAVVGRSGAGKSTLLSVISGLDDPDEGVVEVDGERAAAARLSHCALMLQRDCLLPWRTAIDNAGLALENQGAPRREARDRAAPLFGLLGLGGCEQLAPAKLSGGMRQRVAFVRTLLAGKGVLLLDEPFGALDALTRAELQAWLLEALAFEPRTVILVTHDIEEALLLCDRVVVLAGGRVVAEVPTDIPREGERREVVTSAPFVALREQLLEALG